MSSSISGGSGVSKQADVHAWYEALFSQSPVAIGFSRDGITLDANSAYVQLFGYDSVEELRGHSILEQIAPSDRARIVDLVGQRARGERAAERYLTRGIRKDGTEFPFDITTTRVVVADGPLTIAFVADVSERENAIHALQASEERFRTLSDAAVEGVFVHADGKILLANQAGATMYGVDAASLVGESVLQLAAAESRGTVLEHIRSGSSAPYEAVARRRDGTTFLGEVRGRTLHGTNARVTIIRDVTERRRIEAEQRALAERVRQAQKLESLGVLAGGVAHDFNNILTIIANEVELAKRDSHLASATAARLDAITLATERAADLCRQMMAYTGKAAIARASVDLNALVAEMSSMLEVSIPKKVVLRRELATNLPATFCDPTQLRQIVMNLVINASEAIDAAAGTVCISTGYGEFSAADLARSPAGGEPASGTYVWLEVRDDGVGMDAATVAHMFDPFFTTKFVGRGLGMAAVLGIVRGHSGAIEVESARGRGTRIRVYFPVAVTAKRSSKPPPESAPASRGVVLVVDDEKNIRVSTQLLLEGFGYQVVSASGGAEALQAARTQHVDVALVDLTMPGMDGIETMRGLRKIVPGLPIVLSSGYGAARLEDAQADHPDGVLAKPYTAKQLLAALRQAMHDD